MKALKYLSTVAFAVTLAFSVTVNAQTATKEPESALEKKIHKEILRLPYYGVFDHIAFRVDGGTVTLYGKTHSLGTMKSAERAVKKLPGVVEVINSIEELPPSGFDNRIRQQLVREFANAPVVSGYIAGVNPSVRLIVENGRVTLEGYVPSEGTSNFMYLLANRVPGTFEVTNNLVVTKGRG